MTTVNKPILLDETGKDIASAVREQTQALQTAIQSISIGGGSGGGGDDGYFPSNSFEFPADNPTIVDGTNMYVQIYNPLTASTPPPKQVLLMGVNLDGGTVSNMLVVSALGNEDGVPEDAKGIMDILIPVSLEGQEASVGLIQCYKATDKPLWIIFNSEQGYIMPLTGYY